MRRLLRRNAKYVGAAVVVLAFVFALVAFVRIDSGGPDGDVAGGGLSSPFPTPSGLLPSGSGVPSASTSARPSTGSSVTSLPHVLPRVTLTPAEPGGFTYADLPSHTIVLSASAAVPVHAVAYLIPTSHDNPYGKVTGVGDSWKLTTRVYGKPDYAALFIQAGRSGVPVSCTITIDGRVASAKTTSGAFGRGLCIA